MTFHLRVMYQVTIGWRWSSTPPWSAFWPWHFLNQLKPFWGSKHVLFELVFAKRHFNCILDKARSLSAYVAKRHFTRHTWQSLTKHVLFQLVFAKLGISPGILDKARSLLACFCKKAFHQAYLTKHVLFQLILQNGISPGILEKVWQSMFSFSLFLQNGISPGILDNNDKACSLSACFCKTAFHQAYSTTMTKHVLFQLILQNCTSPGILDKACSLSACFCKKTFH